MVLNAALASAASRTWRRFSERSDLEFLPRLESDLLPLKLPPSFPKRFPDLLRLRLRDLPRSRALFHNFNTYNTVVDFNTV